MSALQYTLRFVSIGGIWRPREWNSGWKYYLYQNFTITVLAFHIYSISGQIIDLSMKMTNINDFIRGMYSSLSTIVTTIKALTVLGYRPQILKMLDTLESDTCRIRNLEEQNIKEYFDKKIRFRTVLFGVWGIALNTSSNIKNMIRLIPKREILVPMWVPFKIENDTVYGIVYFLEFIMTIFMGIVSIAYNSFVTGIILNACIQLKVLMYRMTNIGRPDDKLREFNMNEKKTEREQISECVRHHLLIYEFCDKINRILGVEILITSILTTFRLCLHVYTLSSMNGITEAIIVDTIYFSMIMLMTFLVCCAGTDLSEQSTNFMDGVYQMEWYTLSKSTTTSMLIIMMRSMRPIILSTMKLIQVSLDLFVRIIKISYTAYTFLKQVSD